MFGPDLPPVKKNKPNRRKTKSFNGKSRKAIERRTFERKERRRKKAERLQRIAEKNNAKREEEKQRREEEKQRRADTGEPLVMKVKSKRDPKVHDGLEQVDSIILNVLGKSSKSKRVAGKGKQSVVRKEKVDTQQDAKWKPGMTEVAGERMQRRRPMKKSKEVLQAKNTPMHGVMCQDVGPDVSFKEFSNIKEFSNTKSGTMSTSDKLDMTSSGAETPYLADDNEEESRATHVYGELKGGAGPDKEDLSMTELMRMAIHKAQLQLKLDADTPGLGNCFSEAMLQQFQRPQVKLFLQSRGLKITSFIQLKKEVAEFVRTHMHIDKMKDLKANFEMSQRNIVKEYPHLKPRTWSKYWKDMLIDGEWADDTFIQAFAWYANMHIIIVIAGQANSEQPFYTMEGTFTSETTGPTLLVGYINGNHYQSLLPLQEDRSRPDYLSQTSIDKTLSDTLRTLGFEIAKLKQGSQVGS